MNSPTRWADAEKSVQPGVITARHEGLLIFARLVAPMMPHLAEQMHDNLAGHESMLVAEMPWPVADPVWLTVEQVTVAVQIMGKLRGTIAVTPDATEATVLSAAEAEPNVARLLAGQRIVKRIHVPGRIVNFVVAG